MSKVTFSASFLSFLKVQRESGRSLKLGEETAAGEKTGVSKFYSSPRDLKA